eukprot:1198668-Prorocentrum_lima.AAC.1
MTSSLVGSEMCIRDRILRVQLAGHKATRSFYRHLNCRVEEWASGGHYCHCLLYTSDAADDM